MKHPGAFLILFCYFLVSLYNLFFSKATLYIFLLLIATFGILYALSYSLEYLLKKSNFLSLGTYLNVSNDVLYYSTRIEIFKMFFWSYYFLMIISLFQFLLTFEMVYNYKLVKFWNFFIFDFIVLIGMGIMYRLLYNKKLVYLGFVNFSRIPKSNNFFYNPWKIAYIVFFALGVFYIISNFTILFVKFHLTFIPFFTFMIIIYSKISNNPFYKLLLISLFPVNLINMLYGAITFIIGR